MSRTTTANKKIATKISVRPADWQKGEQKWDQLRQRGGVLGYNNIFDFQANLWGLFVEAPKSINGLPVLIIGDSGGSFFNNHPYPASILKGAEEGGELLLTVLFHPIEEENWDGDRVETIKLFQVMPLQTPPTLTAETKFKVEMSLMLGQLNLSRNSTLVKLRRQEQDYLRYIANYQKELAKYERELAKCQEQLRSSARDFLTSDDLKLLIDKLGKHRKIEWAMLTRTGQIVIQTTMLHVISQKTGKESKKTKLGRFAITISPQRGSIEAMNMDYRGGGYYHPNISGTSICLGGNQTEVTNMLTTGKFYELFDFMIMFFSLFPHDAGSPYMSHSQWLKVKAEFSTPNPWAGLAPLYKVEQDKAIANRVLAVKRKKGTKKSLVTSLLEKIKKPEAEKEDAEPELIADVVEAELANPDDEDYFDNESSDECGCDDADECNCDCACDDCEENR